MNVYYIGLIEGQHLDDIDIGIGTIAYWEYLADDYLIIARNRAEAWRMFLEQIGIPHESVRDHMKRYVHEKTVEWYDDDSTMDLCFHMLLTDLLVAPQIIKPGSGHPLCWLVQHHDKTPTYAAYWAGQYDRPLWVSEAIESEAS